MNYTPEQIKVIQKYAKLKNGCSGFPCLRCPLNNKTLGYCSLRDVDKTEWYKEHLGVPLKAKHTCMKIDREMKLDEILK